MTFQYDQELSALAETYRLALAADVTTFRAAIAAASESSVIGVGSGGSFTVASLLCNLHEAYTGRVSRPSTPLELICSPALASSSPVFLISAEGKNPDITEALVRARRHSARPIHVLTNRASSQFVETIAGLSDVTPHIFELSSKDGYLATNSLLFDAVVVARAFSELDRVASEFPPSLDSLQIGAKTLQEVNEKIVSFVQGLQARKTLIVAYSPLLKPIALDLESKLSESALLNCQLCDFRSFAHGRHLWLSKRQSDCAIFALTEPSIGNLWPNMLDLLPAEVPVLSIDFAGSRPPELVAGLVSAMNFVGALGRAHDRDVAKPDVPDFSRKLYYLSLADSVPPPLDTEFSAELSKFDVMGARWPSLRRMGPMSRARADFLSRLLDQQFRSIVFDYDGTLCPSRAGDQALSARVVAHIEALVRAGVIVGIASGRGASVVDAINSQIEASLRTNIEIGLYNGGWIGTPNLAVETSGGTSEFLSHVTRVIMRLKGLGVPISDVRTTQPLQVSVRFRDGISTKGMWFILADALRQAGVDYGSMVRSKHSVDVLAPGVGKSRLMAEIVQKHKIDPYKILTMGDQGAWPGNDSSLLEHRFSLSVDAPARRLDRGWKLAPSHLRDVDATLWYLDRVELRSNGEFGLRI